MDRAVAGELNALDLVEAADAVRSGATTSVELVRAALAAIDAGDAVVNSVIWLERESALEAAADADAAKKSGRGFGPLQGVPLAHKDLFYRAGQLCSCGSILRKNFRPDCTATVVQRLLEAGSITLGGLNMAEFAQNPTGHNRHFGDCRNPWNSAYIAGGSSSGSAAAVASRFVYAALGSDTGGSIRIPASLCGVTGLKGTQSRVSRYGVMPLSFSCDTVGPLARSARDCARMMRIISGHDTRDPTSSREPVPDYEALLDGDVRGIRIGVPRHYFFDDLDTDIDAALQQALAVFQARGARVVPIMIEHIDAIATYASVVSRVEAAAVHGEWMRNRPHDYAVHLSGRLYAANAIPAVYYVEALARRGALLRALGKEVFAAVDVFIAPALRKRAPTLAATDIESGQTAAMEAFSELSYSTRPINYLGLPAVTVPCGFDSNGIPIGFQVIGRPFAEGRLLKVADAYQRDTEWHRRRPGSRPEIGR